MIRSVRPGLPGRAAPVALFILAAGSLPAWGAPGDDVAPPSSAAIQGRVLGPDHKPLPGVEVRVRAGILDRIGRTGPDGTFRVEDVPTPGVYRIVCSVGSIVETGPEVTVAAGAEVTTADVVLRLRLFEQLSVTADSWTLPKDLPNSVAIRTTEKLSEQNLFNPEDALRYVPSTVIRKRYIGDRNALLGGRSFGTLQPSRGLVFLDGYLLSNLLGRFDAPRWNMVTPEAIERVDVLYGPFSAIHAGNSIGTTIVVTERTPARLEWSGSLTGYGQRFSQYGETDDYRGGQVSGYVGGRLASGWGALTYNHQDSISQPMQYFNVTANDTGVFPAIAAPAIQVSGIRYDTDPRGNRRAVFGGSSGAIDHTVQDSLKLRLGYALTPGLETSALVAGWRNETHNRNRTFLRDATGAEVWRGRVTDGAHTFDVPATAFAPSTREERHRQLGFTLRTRRDAGWNASAVASDYRILSDPARQAGLPDPEAASGGPGTVTRRDGTGWNTFEVQATHAPRVGDGRHAFTFGAHRNAYTLTNVVDDVLDWRFGAATLAQRYRGETEVWALYAQDAWRLGDRLKLTLGWRAERFRTFAGEQLARVASCMPGAGATCEPTADRTFDKVVAYPGRTLTGHSPKASLAWTATDRLLLRASFGRGVRFPNVEELYNGTVTATSVTLSDPDLEAERSNAFELSAETSWSRQTLRASLFHDEVRDAILRQSDNTVTPSITNVSNQDLVRTTGLEAAWSARDAAVTGLSVEANAALTRSRVVRNAKDLATEGKHWLRVPEARANAVLAYRPSPRWMGSLGWRFSTSAYNDVYNRDVHGDVYGGISGVNQLDLCLSHKPVPGLELAVGMDNVTDHHSYQSHPLPGRTLFVQVRASSR